MNYTLTTFPSSLFLPNRDINIKIQYKDFKSLKLLSLKPLKSNFLLANSLSSHELIYFLWSFKEGSPPSPAKKFLIPPPNKISSPNIYSSPPYPQNLILPTPHEITILKIFSPNKISDSPLPLGGGAILPLFYPPFTTIWKTLCIPQKVSEVTIPVTNKYGKLKA